MAKAKRTTRTPQSKAKKADPLAQIRTSMRQLQRDSEKLLTRTRKQAAGLISRDQKRAITRLVDEAKRVRGDLERRAQRAQKQVESRAEKLLTGLEAQLSKAIEPILRRLDLPSRSDIQALTRRIAKLEKDRKAPATGERPRPGAQIQPPLETFDLVGDGPDAES